MNVNAEKRIFKDFNISAFPTVMFDGGQAVEVGAGSVPEAQAQYASSISTCSERTVPNIDLLLSFDWLGDSRIKVNVTIRNNDPTDYSGYLKVYVTETVSSMGWRYADNTPYTFPFLDYAFNESVYVSAGTALQDSTIWDGNEHSDGYGNYFNKLTRGNISLIGAVFNPQVHPAFSYPPADNPFKAFYVDEAAAVWTNLPPDVPCNPVPEDKAVVLDLYSDLNWSGGDSNYFDKVTYDVYFGRTNPPPFVVTQTSTTYDPDLIETGRTYYWRIVSRNNQGDSTAGPVWSFFFIARGDCDGNGNINVADLLYLINYLFRSGPAPHPIKVADVDCDDYETVNDVVYLINYLFKSGIPPACGF
ncbi:MAG TPA: dockerin type I domain-containing protein [Terriglobales bacterium]|nr:dockerin type I domain-containing protein [Terriglobales bacterium]